MEQTLFLDRLTRLFAWARSKDFRGHDPHDLLESPLVRSVVGSMPSPARLVLLQLGRRSPVNLHTMLGVPSQENPKGLALFLSGLVKAKELAAPDWLATSKALAARLLKNEKYAWGYPFAWQSRTHFVPADGPTIVATAFVANALLDLYDFEQDPTLLAAAERSVEFMLCDIPRFESNFGIAFGYGPNDSQVVFNASLLGAELIARVGALKRNEEYLRLANRAAAFVVHYQDETGLWKYGLEPSQTWIDSFHTGFVICSLERISALTNDAQIKDSAQRGFENFRKNFITPDALPRYYYQRTYPIDAHSAAQCILTLLTFGDRALATKVAERSIELLGSEKGYFYYQVHPRYTNRIAYMRWSNAWMFRALAEITRPANI